MARIALLCLAPSFLAWAQNSSPSLNTSAGPAVRLPLRRIVLYKNGIGYFEHAGRVRGNEDVNIDLTTAQLNDVLKSLTVVDRDKGRIAFVSYNSTAPLERQLDSLRLRVGEDPTTVQFLKALRGVRLEVRSGSQAVSGRLLSIDQRELPTKGGDKITTHQLSIVSDAGEVRVFDLGPGTRVRIAEKDVNEEVTKYFGLVASTRDQDIRRMAIRTAGTGERDLLVSYISEVPVWKCTYRILIPSEGKPLLQGWAIVDNTVGEDWKNVELSLVAGAPQSFVQELSQPYYTRRPVVALPENAMATPQTHEATMEETAGLKGQLLTRSNVTGESVAVASGQASGVGGVIGSGSRGGIGSGVFTFSAAARPRIDASVAVQSLESSTTVARTQELGELFEYKLKDQVTIRKNQSALVPILAARIDAEKVSVWNPSQPAVLRALWVSNPNDFPLDGGSFSVLEADTFAGEGLMDLIKPGERRLLSYARDFGLLVEAKRKSEKQRFTNVIIAHGTMTEISEEREEQVYIIRNRDTQGRTVVIEHPARQGWSFADGPEPTESSVSFHRFRVTVEPHKTVAMHIKEYRPISTRYQLTAISDADIDFFLSQAAINPALEKVLRQVSSQKKTVAGLDAEINARKTQISNIAQDQQRVRENMKALKGSAEEKTLVERYARELNDQEDRVQSLERDIANLRQKRDAAQKALSDMLVGLEFEAQL